ncbi:MAG TPA: TIGR03619 family F420-dependent LLM class oxidoreductase [Pseudonocardiaceae bacterium]|jgi:probable F420-dependent oxidoreductase|nr:TIGR03619 family F420-dependent LLM class oxidoreductase [Pseudonocardiaceae bacterium]
MRIGFAVPVAGPYATPENQLEIAVRAEQLGYESLWTMQRVLNPVDSPDTSYRNVPDPLITLAYLAGHTTRARLGVAVWNAPFAAPALLAQQAATLDRLSHGRLDLGLGLGWLAEELTAFGVPTARRGARLEEFLTVLRQLWTDRTERFDGEFYQLPDALVSPTPVQQPRPPILLGGGADAALRRVGRLADGWISASRHDPHDLHRSISVIKEAAERAGRDPESLRFICRAALGSPMHGPDSPLSGSHDRIRAGVAWLGEQGITEVFYDPNFDPTVVGPDVPPEVAVAKVTELLDGLAPGSALRL